MSGRRSPAGRTAVGFRVGRTAERFPVRLAAVALAALCAACCVPSPGPPAGPSAHREAAPGEAPPVPGRAEAGPAGSGTAGARVPHRLPPHPTAVRPRGDDPVPDIRRAVAGARKAGRTAVFVADNLPRRGCGAPAAGGAKDANAYRHWIARFGEALRDARALVVLEPDAVPQIADGCIPARHHDERYRLLSEAVDVLKSRTNTLVYVGAGAPGRIEQPQQLVEPLRRAGVDRADGFALDVFDFEVDEAGRTFGTHLSELLDGAHALARGRQERRGTQG